MRRQEGEPVRSEDGRLATRAIAVLLSGVLPNSASPGTTVAVGVAVGGLLALAPAVASPLGRFSSPFALLIVLPLLALGLEAFGWSRTAALGLRRLRDPVVRLVGAYGVWLGTSALLTLDVAAAAGASVGVEVAGEDAAARRWHLGAAVLGSNVGSLLFPFSNLTNLVLVGAAGIGLASFVREAWLPQLGAALAVGLVLVLRAGRSGDLEHPAVAQPTQLGSATDRSGKSPSALLDRVSLLVGVIALGGGVGAVAFGLLGLDMAVPFALSAAGIVGAAVALGRLPVRGLDGALPIGALGLVAGAALLAGPISRATSAVPLPQPDVGGLALALVVGSLLAVMVNNLPAAAFGSVWLAHATVPIVVAYLIGTNIAAVATPHGSAATMLVRAGGARRGSPLGARDHIRSAWRYALAGSVAAIALLALFAR